jgi:hypothetical protein
VNLFTTYHSRVYRDFKSIEATDYRSLIHFFERHEKKINSLEFDEYFEILYNYTVALFETGAYQKHILMANVVAEACILSNLPKGFHHKTVYRHTLFKKAAAHFNLMEFSKADHILCELLKMDPEDETSARFLNKSLRSQRTGFLKTTRAIGIFLILAAALLVVIDVLFVKSFLKKFDNIVFSLSSLVMISGLLLLLGGELLHRFRAWWEVRSFVNKARRKKKAGY